MVLEEEQEKKLSFDIAYLLNNSNNAYKSYYTDFYRYNRSSSLREIERIFYSSFQSEYLEPHKMEFPRNIMAVAKENNFITERPTLYSDFLGDVYIENDFKMIYETDERGRSLSQVFHDDDGKIIWVIENVWKDNRLASSKKTEGDTVLLAEYEYNSNGDKIIERNYKNGMLERLVLTNGNVDIEELYFNNVLVLRAVWEDGRKISETRIR